MPLVTKSNPTGDTKTVTYDISDTSSLQVGITYKTVVVELNVLSSAETLINLQFTHRGRVVTSGYVAGTSHGSGHTQVNSHIPLSADTASTTSISRVELKFLDGRVTVIAAGFGNKAFTSGGYLLQECDGFVLNNLQGAVGSQSFVKVTEYEI